MQDFFSTILEAFKREEILERKLIISQLTRIEEKVDTVDKKVDYTNGTVRKHTDQIIGIEKDLPHTPDSCPNKVLLKTLSDAHTSNKAVRSWVFTAIGILLGIMGGIVATMEFIMKYKP